jgi:hypothetical protein
MEFCSAEFISLSIFKVFSLVRMKASRPEGFPTKGNGSRSLIFKKETNKFALVHASCRVSIRKKDSETYSIAARMTLPCSIFVCFLVFLCQKQQALATNDKPPAGFLKKSRNLKPGSGKGKGTSCSASLSCPDPLCEDDWTLVAHMENDGDGMFEGNMNLRAAGTVGVPPMPPVVYEDVSPEDSDWKADWSEIEPEITEILFITGDERYWGKGDYQRFRYIVDNLDPDTMVQNMFWERCLNGKSYDAIFGNVLSRSGTAEDPWVSIADGTHFDGIDQGLIIWGENDFSSQSMIHAALKSTHGGVNVLVR